MPSSREEIIRQIIVLEDRILRCCRCNSLIKCTGKPALGKGELQPELMMVFESNNKLTHDSKKLIELRSFIQLEFKLKDIYHTFLVRCSPKACTMRNAIDPYTQYQSSSERYLDNYNICLLKQEPCNGILVRPRNEEIVYCLPFLIEEITILQPRFIILFGQRTAEFVLKSFGFHGEFVSYRQYKKDGMVFLFVNYPQEDLALPDLKVLKSVFLKTSSS
ncbi:MAG: uracil-DNA glycosylase family protein [Syntrophomonas sp.]|uniref:uracil-DNA glycosylase family protein n=1 Tax=Syntrophomonas sp. TaxID=2053627 RepID=UPI0026367ADF|nr:uracil-DNA glycosylase family protein [Syntrophomonas sp.]MDD3879402.1 uracil-DNA glycosylase family protein [Syntrophomonas sp.]MDD4625845.1 uracil-DNA glycosylase family protein [Syntrophomonas sp.]